MAIKTRTGEHAASEHGVIASAWNHLSVGQVTEKLKVHPSMGLSRDEAAYRLAQYGPNAIREFIASNVENDA